MLFAIHNVLTQLVEREISPMLRSRLDGSSYKFGMRTCNM